MLANRLTHHGAALGDPAVRPGAVSAFHDAFFVAALVAATGIIASLLIDDRLAAATRHGKSGAAPMPESIPDAAD